MGLDNGSCGVAATQKTPSKPNHCHSLCKDSSAMRNCPTVDLPFRAFTLWPIQPAGGTSYEIRHLLRTAIAAPVGCGRRAKTVPGRAEPARTGRPLRLRLRVGGGASFSRRIFTLA